MQVLKESFVPPVDVAKAAALGLDLRREFGRGGTAVGVARARDLMNRKGISLDTIGRMRSYFARHAVDMEAAGSDARGFWGRRSNPSAGWIAWLLWGGNPGRSWANKVWRENLEKIEKLVPSPDASVDEKREAQKQRAKEFGIETLENQGERLSYPAGWPSDLDDYGDPVNLKYPLVPDSRARVARSRFKQFAYNYKKESSKRLIHTRIVDRLLDIGAAPGYNPTDPLDKLLPANLREQMTKGEMGMLKKSLDYVEVNKSDLMGEGEELNNFVGAVMRAIRKTAQATERFLSLRGIYKNYVVVQNSDDGAFFKMEASRPDGGEVKLSNEVQVRPVWLPVDSGAEGVQKSAFRPVSVPALTLLMDGDNLTSSSVKEVERVAKSLEESSAPDYVLSDSLEKPEVSLWSSVLKI